MRSLRFGWSAVLIFVVTGCGGKADSPAPADTRGVASPSASVPPSAAAETKPAEPTVETPFELEEGFKLLSFDDFAAFTADEALPTPWSATETGLICAGKPKGYLYSKGPYQNFTWRLEYRFPRPPKLTDDEKFKGNTGFLVFITGDHKLWPICLEVQGKFVQMGAIKENGGANPVVASIDEAERQKARKPVGEWNSLEIVAKAGALNVSLNGMSISHSEPNFLSEGLIGIQAEDHPFEVRRMRIRAD